MDAQRISNSAGVDAALKAANVPFVAVYMPTDDPATWRVELAPSATPQQQANADAIVHGYVPKTAAQIADDDAQRETSEKKLKAVALALWECIPAPMLTKAQLKARAVAIYKTL